MVGTCITSTKHISIESFALLIHWRFTTPSSMESEAAVIRTWGIQTWDPEIWVRWRRTIPMHGNQPGRGDLVSIWSHRHPQGCSQVLTQVTRLLLFQPDFKLLLFVVQITMQGQLWHGLPLGKIIVLFLVVDVSFSQIWSVFLTPFGFHSLSIFFLL